MHWIKVEDRLPTEGRLVITKIHDTNGERNEQPLKRQGKLWFHRGGATYVYYTPTHWWEEGDKKP